MRIQKLLIIFLVAGSGLGQAFSQTALSGKNPIQLAQNSAAEAAKTPELEDILRTEQDALRKALEKAEARKKAAAAPAPKSTSEEFFRAKKAKPAQVTTTPAQPSRALEKISAATSAPSDDSLVEILRKKQAELDALEASGKPSTPARVQTSPVPAPRKDVRPVPAQPAVTKPAPIAPRRPITQPKKVVSQPAVDASAEAQLVEALRKKQAELDAKEGIVRPVAPPAVAKPVEAKKPAVAVTPSTKDRKDSEERIKRIEAEIKAKEEAAKKAAAAKPAPVQKKEVAKSTKADVKNQPAAQPTIDPNSKQGRLAELLRKYKADEITPHDYHLQRAKIVAEP